MRSQVSMSPDDIRNVAQQLKKTGVQHVAYLNQGEPFISKRIGEQLETIREVNPEIRIDTSTNGVLIDSDEKREAALLFDKMQISLDGMSQKTAAKYQRGIDFESAYNNMRDLVRYRDERGLDRPIVVWKYLLFRWNERRDQVQQAIAMAKRANVDEILFEKTVSPIHGLPWRSYLGLHDHIGEPTWRGRYLVLRPYTEPDTPRPSSTKNDSETEATTSSETPPATMGIDTGTSQDTLPPNFPVST